MKHLILAILATTCFAGEAGADMRVSGSKIVFTQGIEGSQATIELTETGDIEITDHNGVTMTLAEIKALEERIEVLEAAAEP